MKIKVSKLANAVPSIKYLMGQTIQVKVALKLAKLINAISDEMSIVEETRKVIFLRYSEKDQIPEINKQKFEEEMKILFDTEIEIPLESIHINEVGAIAIPISHMMALEFMFKE